jgi:hypothetical protein
MLLCTRVAAQVVASRIVLSYTEFVIEIYIYIQAQ